MSHRTTRPTLSLFRSILSPIVLVMSATLAFSGAMAACNDSPSDPASPAVKKEGKDGKEGKEEKEGKEGHGKAGRAAAAAAEEGRGESGESLADDKDKDKDGKEKKDKGDKDKDGKDKDKDKGDKGGGGDDAKRSHGHTASAKDVTFYVSMHGEQGGNTIQGVTADGTVVGSVLTGAPQGETLKDLRGMCLLGDGSLLVVNAWMQNTRIIQFSAPGPDGVRTFQKVYIKGGEMNSALQHTYSVIVGPDGSIYCSNQDSNTVTRYAGPGTATPGEPLPAPPALKNFGNMPPGIFVPNNKMSPEGISEVRGLCFGPDGNLYVADRTGSRVSVYDPKTGERVKIIMSEKDGLKHPIQIAFTDDGKFMFVGDNGANCVWRRDMDTGAVVDFVKKGAGGLDAPSAVVLSGDHLYVGNRIGKSIIRFKMPEGKLDPKPFVEKLPDNPEFLLKVH